MAKTDGGKRDIDVEDLITERLKNLRINITANGDYGGGQVTVELWDGDTLISQDHCSTSRISAAQHWDSYEG